MAFPTQRLGQLAYAPEPTHFEHADSLEPTVSEGDDPNEDSGYDDESVSQSDTMSILSEVTNYRIEHGRRYHAFCDGVYWGPNDEQAQSLQDMTHSLYLATFGGRLHLAPVLYPQEILDIGTGSGVWAIDAADVYPGAKITGVDLSPVQPSLVPLNCFFEIDDVALPWTFAPNRFDLIYVRDIFGSIPDWSDFLAQCWRCLRPGGYVEIVGHSVEPISDDCDIPCNHVYSVWGQTIAQAGRITGKSFSVWQTSARHLKQAGFVDICRLDYKWPVHGWNPGPQLRELGRLNQNRMDLGAEDTALRLLTSTLQWSEDRARKLIAEMRSAIQESDFPAYLPVTVVHGRKPAHS
ncbi:S-adenosyl-L-methionine-dependent methyltransferase [Aspergillus pseudoustus]|uniref:S-adenosyl-L-methionine-dependent methyltransferase n=1 Tax=Aspergillus pseudoustus TaxID=1810923 RepID=A0ABR4IUK5_9EURO